MLLRYVEDACSRSEMREIDRHLATCPMCSDAVEGLMLLSEPSVAVVNLNKRIDARVAEIGVGKPTETVIETPVLTVVEEVVEEVVEQPLRVVKRSFWQQRWAAAAAILLLATGSIWVYNSSQKIEKQAVTQVKSAIVPNSDTVFDANKTPQYAAAETAKTSLNLPQSNAPSVEENKNINKTSTGVADLASEDVKDKSATNLPTDADFKKLPKQATETEKAVETDSKIATKMAAPTSTYGNLPQTDHTRDYPGASQQNSVPRPAVEMPSKYEAGKRYEDKTADVKASESKESMEEVVVIGAAKAKKSQPYSTPYKSQVTPSVPNASDAILSRADAYFKQKEYEKAATEYTQFTNSETSGDRYERALFQIASAYVKLNRKAEAKAIFEKLVNMNGQFERASKKALKDL